MKRDLRSTIRNFNRSLGLGLWLGAALFAGAANAETIRVTHFDDGIDDTDGTCTLREAVRSANSQTDIDACLQIGPSSEAVILLSAGTYQLDLAGNDPADDTALRGDLDIQRSMVISGVDAGYTIIDGDTASSQERIIDVIGAVLLVIESVTVTGGNEAGGDGGNIRLAASGGLIMTDSIISNGSALRGGGVYALDGVISLSRARIEKNSTPDDGLGGGVYAIETRFESNGSAVSGNVSGSGGGLFLSNTIAEFIESEITDNEATASGGEGAGCGGGIVLGDAASAFEMTRTLVSGNKARLGGGVCWAGAATGDITHSAIVNNSATEDGGGVWAIVDGFIRYSTISGNSAASGGGLYVASPNQFLLDAVTLAGNTDGGGLFNMSNAIAEFSLFADNVGGNCLGSAPGAGPFNLDDGTGCSFPVNDPNLPSLIDTDPMLGPLQDNGGGLPTLALMPDSPAIDAFSGSDRLACLNTPDQRTYTRGYSLTDPIIGPESRLCDIGAYEFTAPILVNTTEDTVDADTDDGICADANGACSLRAAILQTNAMGFYKEIELGPETYSLTLAGADENISVTGDLDVSSAVLIKGSTEGTTTIDGVGLDRIFDFSNKFFMESPLPVATTLRDLVLTGGVATEGGAISSAAQPLELNRVTLRSNQATAGRGGAVLTDRPLRAVDSTFDDNEASGNGGAIYIGSNAELTLDSTTVSNNRSSLGAGIEASDTVRARNTTFSGNTATSSSAAFFATSAILENTTIANNEVTGANGDSGAFFLLEPSVIVNSIVAGNRVGTVVDNCSLNPFVDPSVGNNITDTDAADCGFDAPTDLVDTEPTLGPLADNGGLTQTHALLIGSPAIDAGNDLNCPSVDQRGFSRPVDGSGNGAANCDIGALEALSTDVSVVISATPNPVTLGSNVTLTVTVSNSDGSSGIAVTAQTVLPTGLDYVSSTLGNTSCSEANGEVNCDFGDLPVNASASADIVVTASTLGDLAVAVEVMTATTDTALANNATDTIVTVNAAPTGGGGGGSGGGGSGSGGGGGGALGLGLLLLMSAALGCRSLGRLPARRPYTFRVLFRLCRHRQGRSYGCKAVLT